jgi:Zn-dependent protease
MQRKRGLEIGRPLGFPLLVHGSWFPAGALLIAHLTVSAYGGHDLVAAILLSVSTVLLFFLCVALKELAQAVVAGVVRTPFADVTLYIFGGIPRSARPAKRPIQDVVVGLAGPAFAAVLGIVGLSASSHFHGIPGDVLWTTGIANLALAGANLLPGTPLDGGRILVAVLTGRTHDRRGAEVVAGRAGQLLGVLSILAGVWFVAGGLSKVERTAVGLWLVVGGLIVAACATRARRTAITVRRLGDAKAGEWAKPFAGRLSVDASVPREGTYAVADGSRLAGVAVGRSGEAVRDVMVPWTHDISVRSDEPLSSALGRLASGSVLVVVDDNGTVRGVLDGASVREHL